MSATLQLDNPEALHVPREYYENISKAGVQFE
ncbi:hypothetical protein G9444_1443 [Rhodococcus erythropolis]|uniref:Uncharacterized protein n=1 Tax=Rhodococcus erythropolis TaxID=1833 RepID=A0A6G9CNV4_RHOER|nr:hypothetical protein N806_25690 [Rhodococcus sp. P27]QIP38687.1 hypothetical protein G9444_1443 [Rhodococcus erythropolis]